MGMKTTNYSGKLTELPDHVYLVTVDGEWPVTAIAADHPSLPDRLQQIVEKRVSEGPQRNVNSVHVWRVPVIQCVEVELVPKQILPAQIKVPGEVQFTPVSCPEGCQEQSPHYHTDNGDGTNSIHPK